MDPDDRPYSLGWADDGQVEPRAVHGREDVQDDFVERVEQDDLDTWWAKRQRGRAGMSDVVKWKASGHDRQRLRPGAV
jgi:hypothetical protein